ncbi:MAG: HDIG domain-containing protein [Desulfovibrionaceae bacterium]|nr:HDIG domain-containing protein [Desulfovibrionaceae bacterium]
MISQKKEVRKHNVLINLQNLKKHHKCRWSLLVLIFCLFFLSFFSGMNFNTTQRMYQAGDIAETEVIADKELFVEDPKGTQERIDQAVLLMPKIYDLTVSPFLKFQEKLMHIIRCLNIDKQNLSEEEKEILNKFRQEISPALAEEILPELAKPEVQHVLINKIFPFILKKMSSGMVSDIRSANVGRAGILIRDLDAQRDILRPEVSLLPDVQTMLAELSVKLRQDPKLSPSAKQQLNVLFSTTLPPASLTLNQEATKRREEDIRASIGPVYYTVQKGEVIVHKGEKVTREQQIKLQAFFQSNVQFIAWDKTIGTFILALLFAGGFFMAPSGKPGTTLTSRDIIFISSLLLLFGLGALGAYLLSLNLGHRYLSIIIALFPVASCVGITSTIFTARRYCTMGLLVSFFSTLLLHAQWQIFIAYFLSCMLFNWLIVLAYSRQDAIFSLFPFALGQSLIWMGLLALSQVPLEFYSQQLICILISSFLSLFLLFAISPILEMLFGYSTRFRLMELMSLEQPLMQQLMVTAPGTYHHSLIVANMVEAGAKAIGANSLLCKVAALYHDIGKTTYPEYFIENQYGGANRHDKLAPSMSALILLSHVKKGVELAKQYKLGNEISDIIQQHHGTRIMQFFYQKALKMGENPIESDYSYPGPRPQTKESAIIMLADSVEASSRTLTDPTPARIKNHIDKIVKGIFAEGQLDESELTFKDLHHLSVNFQRILTGIFHQRIAYPDSKKNEVNSKIETNGKEDSSLKANNYNKDDFSKL